MKQKLLLIGLTVLGIALVYKGLIGAFGETYPMLSRLFLAFVMGYGLGSIPFGFILTRSFMKTDIRHIGSGNIGATNVLRTGKKALAAITLFLDLMKGAIAVYCARYFMMDVSIAPLFAAGGAVFGHCFPIWLSFKGGKAVATAAGVLFALNPWVGSITGIVWALTLLITRYSSLSALMASLATPIAVILVGEDWSFFYFTIVLTGVIIIRHHSNIKRLINGEELKIGK